MNCFRLRTIERRGLFQPAEVKRIIDANNSGREDYSLQVFQLLNLELWHRQFIEIEISRTIAASSCFDTDIGPHDHVKSESHHQMVRSEANGD